MGGGRKNKGGSSSSSSNRASHHHHGGGGNSHSGSGRSTKRPSLNKIVDDQLYQCMEVEVVSSRQSCRTTWKEGTLCLFTLMFLAATCLLAAVSAGVIISVHYFQQKNTVALHRITIIDDEISDVQRLLSIQIDNEDVVQELPPLNAEEIDIASLINQTTHSSITVSEPTIKPSLCPDGVTMGFQDWNTLRSAIHEANRISAERFMKGNQFLSAKDEQIPLDDVSLYYEQDVFFTICPDMRLRGRRGPIFINAENIVLECDGCTIDVGGSHLNFGPHAKNVLVRGITFRGAQTSSLTFYHDGSDAAFEDCYWFGNAGNGKSGAVADVNSTSSVVFYRCEIDDANNVARYSHRGVNPGLASSLSIRAN